MQFIKHGADCLFSQLLELRGIRPVASFHKALDPDWDELGVWVSRNLARLFATEDHKEGVAAFLEKRPAVYRGR